MANLKDLLDGFYKGYNFLESILNDPIEFPHKYKDPEDIEIAGFISSLFAYGRVDLFKAVVRELLLRLDKSPYHYLISFNAKKQANIFSDLSYRFNKSKDIVSLLFIIHRVIKEYGSIENAFMNFYNGDMYTSISLFIRYILSVATSSVYGKHIHTIGLLQFFPDPKKGSPCKRINMFLRWMVRDRDIDFGLWKGIPKDRLIIPLDTHIARISRCIGLTERRSNNWKTAEDITDSLKKLDPEDPLKYDFALCHHGISGNCRATLDDKACSNCIIGRRKSII